MKKIILCILLGLVCNSCYVIEALILDELIYRDYRSVTIERPIRYMQY